MTLVCGDRAVYSVARLLVEVKAEGSSIFNISGVLYTPSSMKALVQEVPYGCTVCLFVCLRWGTADAEIKSPLLRVS